MRIGDDSSYTFLADKLVSEHWQRAQTVPRQFQFFASLLCLLQVFFKISTCQKEGPCVALSGGKAALQPAGVLLGVPAELTSDLTALSQGPVRNVFGLCSPANNGCALLSLFWVTAIL